MRTNFSNLFTARIPFTFLTAKADVAERFYGRKLGADDYLTKHCRVKDLVRAIVQSDRRKAIARVCELTHHQSL